jgi:PAS domain S-box-containing protein
MPKYRPQDMEEILDKLRGGQHIKQFETVRLRKDGSTVEVSLTVSPVRDGEGRLIGACAVSRDITQRKQEENERLALIQDLTAALAKANNIKTPASVP